MKVKECWYPSCGRELQGPTELFSRYSTCYDSLDEGFELVVKQFLVPDRTASRLARIIPFC